MLIRKISSAALLAFSANIYAGYLDGNMLYERCATKEEEQNYYVNVSDCRGYITGVADILDGISFCIPHQVTRGQNADIVTKYLNEHPEDRHKDAGPLTAYALALAFPCPPKK
ncbi:Rap1a/Tai family immunity protein [Aeromonas molluscorum]|uniref:Rap1a/Tai family immunity protein n=1 Tax=Aeromonas molluscorum TaxID=271417 RepID=UPI003F1A655A